jgi:phosphatidylglycerophosphate synthase
VARQTLTVAGFSQVILLVLLSVVAGLGPVGWLAGLAAAAAGGVGLIVGLRRAGARSFGPADHVTLARAVLVGGVTALVADTVSQPAPVPLLITLAGIALAMDAVDGRVARRTGTCSRLGARFDMEVDAFLILVLSAYVALSLGPWVLAIGAMRYAFAAAAWVLPWLRTDLPRSIARKAVAAVQGIALAVAASDLLPSPGASIVTGLALAALVWSFGTDGLWLLRHRPVPVPAPRVWQPRRVLAHSGRVRAASRTY